MNKWIFRAFVGPIAPGDFTKKQPEEPIKPVEADVVKIGTPKGILFGQTTIIPKLAWYGDVKVIKQKVDSAAKK